MNREQPPRDGRRCRAAMVFCGLLLLPSVVWLWRDCHVWDWDPAEYGYLAIDLWRSLWTSPRLWPWMFFHAVGPKAPTLIWIAQFSLPLRHVFGSAEPVFHLINLAFQWGSLFLLWLCANRVAGKKWVAYAMCIGLAGMPLFVGMSQDFLTEPMQLFAVLFVWFIAVSGKAWSAARLTAFLLWGGAFALGAKASTPVYCVVPGAYSLYLLGRSIRGRHWGLNVWNGAGIAAGSLHLAVIAGWYVLNRGDAVQKMVDASVGEAAYSFGYKDTFLNKLAYWGGALGRSMTLEAMAPLLILLVVALAASLAWRARKSGGVEWRRLPGREAALAGLQVGVVLTVLSLNISTPIRYVYALLPSVLLLVAPWPGLLDGVGPRRWALSGLGVWFAGSQLLLMGWVPAAEVQNARHWRSPERNPARIRQVEQVIQLLNIPACDGGYHLCGADFSWLNGSTLNYYAALDSLDSGRRTRFARLGGFVTEVEPAWERVHGQLGSYVAASDSLMAARADTFGQVSREILGRIQADPRFAREAHAELPEIVLYRNVLWEEPGSEGRPRP